MNLHGDFDANRVYAPHRLACRSPDSLQCGSGHGDRAHRSAPDSCARASPSSRVAQVSNDGDFGTFQGWKHIPWRLKPAGIGVIKSAFFAITFRLEEGESDESDPAPLRLGLGAAATLAAAALVVALPNAALPVLTVGLAATALHRLRPALDLRDLTLLFALAVGLGTIARLWGRPAHLLESSGMWTAAGIGAVASVLVNNLPAAVLLSARPTAHTDALLLGLDLGPNLAVTGSLSAVLWLQAARNVDARASIMTYSRLGLVLVPLTLAAALTALLATQS